MAFRNLSVEDVIGIEIAMIAEGMGLLYVSEALHEKWIAGEKATNAMRDEAIEQGQGEVAGNLVSAWQELDSVKSMKDILYKGKDVGFIVAQIWKTYYEVRNMVAWAKAWAVVPKNFNEAQERKERMEIIKILQENFDNRFLVKI